MTKRKFNPRKMIPKNKLINLLEEGYTLQEIGIKHNMSRSYVSELCKFHNIELDSLENRKENMKKRRDSKKSGLTFIDVMYDRARKEIR